MHKLDLPVPPTFEAALCYEGEARYVRMYWELCGDEPMYDDGHIIADASWDGFLGFVDHPHIAPYLRFYHLGSSDSPARHCLILDRQERAFSIASISEAVRFVRAQWPAAPPTPIGIMT